MALLLLSKFDIISWISFLVQGDIKNDSLHRLVNYIMMKRFKGLYWWKGLKVCLTLDWMFGGTEKKVIKTASIIYWIGEDLPLLLGIVFGDSYSFAFREIIDLIPFHMFFISLILFFK